ncbi:helix-turn-helix domain-containing protein [Pseudomonas viridiflava]|uniref:helix-turn-helix domain-containing protein n=1 Tax=Pseudomonas viridiflava TaxID=33069 RepID=UPI000F0864FF|nr:helix-turn-helix transcriptional regulator [Pseudomonas viridiflava]
MNSYSALKSRSKDRLSYWLESAKQDFMISIHNIMLKEKISNAELAGRIGCSPAYISKILRGDANFTIETMVKISRALKTKLCIHLSDPHESIQWRGIVVSKRRAVIEEGQQRQWAKRPRADFEMHRMVAHG